MPHMHDIDVVYGDTGFKHQQPLRWYELFSGMPGIFLKFNSTSGLSQISLGIKRCRYSMLLCTLLKISEAARPFTP